MRASRQAAGGPDDDDAFLGEDIGHPNPRAQYRGYKAIVYFLMAAGVIALVCGIVQGAQQVIGAFPSIASLADGAAWDRLFAGLGRLTLIGLIILAVALIWRWRLRRAATRRRTPA